MKLGFGLYHHMLNDEHYRFARQCGATHIVAHLVDYFHQGADHPGEDSQPIGGSGGWGLAGANRGLFTYETFVRLKEDMAQHGLELEAIENFDPADWHDVLLDGPKRAEQMERLKQIVRDAGRAGIGVIGYNFSIAGVASRVMGPYARGEAPAAGMEEVDDTPIPNGMVWNMVYDRDAPPGVLPEISHDELWDRLARFLNEILPVAEEAGVRLAAHPDDPPAERVRRQPRLVYRPDLYQKLIDINPSPSNCLEFCLGTLMEMPEGDIYEAIEQYVGQGRAAYIHFRNVRGKAPMYHETFIDEGDLDMPRVIAMLKRLGYEGVVIPDHTPQMACAAPWHAGMAYAMGYIKALDQAARP
ncbi:MAG: mannonate dehydratase [Candidatus Hydrogenedentota bacterium]